MYITSTYSNYHFLKNERYQIKRNAVEVRKLLSSGSKSTDDLEEHIASIFGVEYAEQDISLKAGAKLLSRW
jgi:hypothetical protein